MQPVQNVPTLRVLLVEDSETDTELIVREFGKHGYTLSWTRAETEEEFLSHLASPLDLITLDAIMPRFDATRALEVLKVRHLDIPCLIISGSIGEEDAVALIRAGASDYLMKDRLGRLGQAVRYVLEQRTLREEHARAHTKLLELNAELERRVTDRTAQLKQVNQDLAKELAERRHIESLLRNHEAHLEVRVAHRTAQLERSQSRLRRLASQLTLTEHAERKRLAADLHDYLAQLLVASRLKVNQLLYKSSKDDAQTVLQEIDSHLDEMLTYTRTLVSQLSPEILFRRGLVPALHWLAEDMQSHGLTVTVICTQKPDPLPDDQAVLLFQSVRELLYNVRKHAHTSDAVVEVKYADQRLLIVVQDNGLGFDETVVTEKPGSFGLFSIRERIEGLSGSFAIQSAPGHGTRVELRIPLVKPTSHVSAPKELGESTISRSSPLASSGRLRVLIVDDHVALRQQLTHILSEIGPFDVVGEASNGQEAITLAKQLIPDLVLMDINIPAVNGIEATKTILTQHPHIRIIGVTMHQEPQILTSLVEAGAAAAVSKSELPSKLWPTIQKVLEVH